MDLKDPLVMKLFLVIFDQKVDMVVGDEGEVDAVVDIVVVEEVEVVGKEEADIMEAHILDLVVIVVVEVVAVTLLFILFLLWLL